MKYQDNATKNSRVIRISLSAYVKLRYWCYQFNKTMAEVIDEAVDLLEKEIFVSGRAVAFMGPEVVAFINRVTIPFVKGRAIVHIQGGVRKE